MRVDFKHFFERKQLALRLPLETSDLNRKRIVPLIKYTVFASVSLVALLTVVNHLIAPAPAAAPDASTSLDVLRKMANHGEVRGFAPLAAAGPFLPMPVITPSMQAANEAVAAETPAVAAVVPSAALNAQARIAEADLIDKPLRAEKKVAPRKPRPRAVYVENMPRGQSGGLFGVFNTW